MVQINRLRLSGFKSFVDKTELDIGTGLNGIVGPNGCGKSNLVEALRWVMGENRAKHMRSGEMNDVIFAGTAARAPRSIAEVSVLLDNSDNTAPHPFNGATQIEVTRRIERDKGSQYLVNGKVVRARDVHMLFADSMTGAHSPALVSQGRVTQLIQAKPTERRKMLEESAGVASLYTRRGEAELRLKAAEENLGKLDLVMGELTHRANALRAQAKQAQRYRHLSTDIRRFEALLAWQEWAGTRDKLKREEQRFADTEQAVRDAMIKASALNVEAEKAQETLDSARMQDAEARAALQLLRQSAEQLDREAGHRRQEYNDIERQIVQTQADADLAGEQQEALKVRASTIAADLANTPDDDGAPIAGLAELEDAYEAARAAAERAENDVLARASALRQAAAERERAEKSHAQAAQGAERAAARLGEVQAQYNGIQTQAPEETELEEVLGSLKALKEAYASAEAQQEAAQDVLENAREAMALARSAQASLQQEKTLKEREIKSLNDMLGRASQGFEGSLLLAGDIPATLSRVVLLAAGEHAARANKDAWGDGTQCFDEAEWPQGVTPLSQLIKVDEALGGFVSSIGVLDAGQDGARLAGQLLRGQVLVSREGQLWRWDGLRIAKAQSEAGAEAQILSLREQIKQAQAKLDEILPALEAADASFENQSKARENAAQAHAKLQSDVRAQHAEIKNLERRIEGLQRAVNARSVRRSVLEGQQGQAQEVNQAAIDALAQAAQVLAACPDASAQEVLAQELQSAEELLKECRVSRDDLSGQIQALKAAARQAAALRANLVAEGRRTDEQLNKISAHTDGLQSRLADLQNRKEALRPQIEQDETGTERDQLLEKIVATEEAGRSLADAFAIAEKRARTLAIDLKQAEEDGSTCREKRAVIQATVQALQNEVVRIRTDIDERFSCSPSALENSVMPEWPEGVPHQARARSERDHLVREREALGAVNLRAEEELTEAQSEHERLEAEKADLEAAIARLREGIGKLNVEARDRIVKTFNDVNHHFKDLFKRLFAGGEACLKLVDSADPLEAGLEIFAQPPGKTLQSLNLLSGGEQTLTALSLIFSMFLSNPSPVCVLDEVDAPLDDANVDRVCTLLEEMSNRCSTRFLVISHHRMTMARMGRLYGVTMGERGVSQLVSVNMAAQGALLEGLEAA